MTRPFDLTLFGATGYTGQLVARFLDEHAPSHLRWALAGRRTEALETLRASLKSRPGLVCADASDSASLQEMARQTRVICSTAGPYSRWGTPVVAACVGEKTHYCDLTGEVPWMARTVRTFQSAAVENQVRIVHSCGFDSIPFDLSVYLTQQAAARHFGRPCTRVEAALTHARGGFSGGTIHSLLGVLDEARNDPEVRTLLRDTLCLVEPHAALALRQAASSSDGYGLSPASALADVRNTLSTSPDPHWGWCAPHVMASINSRVVRRSQALLPELYGNLMAYDEFMAFGAGTKARAKATLISMGVAALFAGLRKPLMRKALERTVLPAPGQGPSAESRDKGFFRVEVRGQGISSHGAPFTITTKFHAQGDPGYAATSRMLALTAIGLAEDQIAFPQRWGVLTPASVFGDHLVDTFQQNGFRISTTADTEANKACEA